jgi:glycosyltransferase involved in cell wall biosynthesis
MHIAIRAPDDAGEGDDLYNRRMVEALRGAGHEAAVVAPDAAAPGEPWIVVADDRLRDFGGARLAVIHDPARLTRERLQPLQGVIAAGAAVAARLVEEFEADRAKIHLVPPGVEHGVRSKGSGGPCLILSVGAITPRRGCDALLRALAKVVDVEWRLIIAGAPRDAAYAESLRALAGELAIAPRVTFAGALGEDAMAALWSRADMFALASVWEPHGTAVADALARGVPVVATEAAAAGVAVPPEAGALCEDETALSRALRRAVCDAGLREDLADGAWRAGQALPDWDFRARAFAAALAAGSG